MLGEIVGKLTGLAVGSLRLGLRFGGCMTHPTPGQKLAWIRYFFAPIGTFQLLLPCPIKLKLQISAFS
jgi:hypothetical protein